MLDIECNDTIVAKATPDGKGAIAIIRISGKESKKIIEKITKPVRILKPFYLYRTNIFDYKENKKIDDVLVVNMPEGKSYTGENMAEIYCHGGEFVTLSIINLILQFNVRYAEKGEFSYRAVKNK
jgi:tRNA modification GTPase